MTAPDGKGNALRVGDLSPGILAYIGDAVFELFVREALILAAAGGRVTTESLHRRATELVRASAQARMAKLLAPELAPEEADVMRRGRNAHCGRVPAGAEVADYRLATGLECLIGHLHLSGRNDRIKELLEKAIAFPTGGTPSPDAGV